MIKNICILGSTGSIGVQTLEAVSALRKFDEINVLGLTANKSIELLERQINEFSPKLVALTDEASAFKLKDRLKGKKVEILTGIEGVIEVARLSEADTVVNALVGGVGLAPTLSAINAGKNIALANKETLVCAGSLLTEAARQKGVSIIPIDSEHSAIFQCLQGNSLNKIKKIILTASGGPFRNLPAHELSNVTVEAALKHPNWAMGQKITIDSATMMNKGLEVIEAKWLFDVNINQIEVAIHPESIIHSMVEYEDNAIMAQLGAPDMRVPILYALTHPRRVKNEFKPLNIFEVGKLTFEKPDLEKFRCLKLAFEALSLGGTYPAVLNMANEIAVERFLARRIGFLDIPALVEKTLSAHVGVSHYSLEDIFSAEDWVKSYLA